MSESATLSMRVSAPVSVPEPGPALAQPASPSAAAAPSPMQRSYLRVLTWAFTLFNSLRVVSYLPTIFAIHASGDSGQHSLWTWCIWLGANSTMAGWLYEHNGRRLSRAIAVNLVNAAMCAATVVLIASHRHWLP